MRELPGPKGLTPPYYAVIFSSLRSQEDEAGYQAMAVRMEELAQQMPGYLGAESLRGADGYGVTISYWRDTDAIRAWKQHSEHILAQGQGRQSWYECYSLRITRVERDYHFQRDQAAAETCGSGADAEGMAG
ncbi:MAG: antibiotic biosynthesis monooxygenase [Sphingobium sp.]|nr:antibiotic biosynthesis monooxygenase [Sphingobium sp.]